MMQQNISLKKFDWLLSQRTTNTHIIMSAHTHSHAHLQAALSAASPDSPASINKLLSHFVEVPAASAATSNCAHTVKLPAELCETLFEHLLNNDNNEQRQQAQAASNCILYITPAAAQTHSKHLFLLLCEQLAVNSANEL